MKLLVVLRDKTDINPEEQGFFNGLEKNHVVNYVTITGRMDSPLDRTPDELEFDYDAILAWDWEACVFSECLPINNTAWWCVLLFGKDDRDDHRARAAKHKDFYFIKVKDYATKKRHDWELAADTFSKALAEGFGRNTNVQQ